MAEDSSNDSSMTSCKNGRCCCGLAGLKWTRTSPQSLKNAEERMLRLAKVRYELMDVTIENGNVIHTIVFNKESQNTPLVMVHGFGGGLGVFTLNYAMLSANRPVYAIDLLGFGCSSRPRFENDAMAAEIRFMESIEQWRNRIGINIMILLGLSFGGYLSSSYALKYPDRIRHLILVEPWGFTALNKQLPSILVYPSWAKPLKSVLVRFNPFAAVRVLGPLGPRVFAWYCAEWKGLYVEEEDEKSPIFDYFYQCNAMSPSGEIGFMNLTKNVEFAANPMINRIGSLKSVMPLSFIYGSDTPLDINGGHETKVLLPDNPVTVHIIKSAGHKIYAQRPDEFNNIVNSICEGTHFRNDNESIHHESNDEDFDEIINSILDQDY